MIGKLIGKLVGWGLLAVVVGVVALGGYFASYQKLTDSQIREN